MSEWLFPAVVIIFAFVAAGFVKGVIGMGMPSIAMGLLGIVFAPLQAAVLILAPNLVTNLWQAGAGPRLAILGRRLWPMGLGIWAGIWLGSGVLTSGDSRLASLGLGALLTVYGCLGFVRANWQFPARHESWASPLVGLATGLIAGATGLFVVPAVPYIQALGLEKEELIQALALTFIISALALGSALLMAGVVSPALAWGSVFALAPALGGMFLGQKLRRRISALAFRKCLLLGLIALGLYIAARAAS